MDILKTLAEVVAGAAAVIAIVLPYLLANEHRLSALETKIDMVLKHFAAEPLRPA